jgi:hypothetical protein
LSDTGFGEDLVHEVSRAFCHSSSAAGAAKSAFLTGKRDQLFMFAVGAPDTQETMSENPAAEEGFEFLGDVLGKAFSLYVRNGLEGAVVSGYRLVEDGLLGSPGLVLSGLQTWQEELC